MYVNECIWSIFWHIWKPSGGQTGNRFQLEWLLRHFNTKPGQTHGLWVFFPQWFGAHSWVLAVECGSSQSRWFLDRTIDAFGFKHEKRNTDAVVTWSHPNCCRSIICMCSPASEDTAESQNDWCYSRLLMLLIIHIPKTTKNFPVSMLALPPKKSMVPHFSQVAEPWPLWNHLLCDGYHLHAKLEPGWQLHNRRSATSITAEVGKLVTSGIAFRRSDSFT